MHAEELKRHFGNEYPAAITVDGVRMLLSRENRFSRSYSSVEPKMKSDVSRFMDGSASITLAQLERGWPTWAEDERLDFCNAFLWLDNQPDFPSMLRFIMQNGEPHERSSVVVSVGMCLPRDEAFDMLVRELRTVDIGSASNITCGIAKTKHPEALALLRNEFQSIWAHTCLWHNDAFVNQAAFDATTCIASLIELGAPASDFDDNVRQLSQHVCALNRDSCRNFLAGHYSWLNEKRALPET